MVLENGIREIVGEVRNSLDFHRSQEGGGEVRSVVLSGPALELRGFPEALEGELGIAVRRRAVRFADPAAAHAVSPHRLAIATGLATEEAPR
jgi:type IV pilus assembly protein PilM